MATEPRGEGSDPGSPLSRRDRRALVGFALALSLVVVGGPFALSTHPPLTDLPYHAAATSILRHYFDPSFGFREQFSFHPLEAPYVTQYLLGAALAFLVPITTATALSTIAMLLLLPAGLAVLLRGMDKNPFWGLSALALTWSTVTHWGFSSHLGATGLTLLSAGLALLVLRRPTRARQVALAAALVAVFFTHVFRLPFTLIAVALAAWAAYPQTRRLAPLGAPVLPAAALFAVWLAVRPAELAPPLELGFWPERILEIPRHLFGAHQPFDGAPPTAEGRIERALSVAMLVALGAGAGWFAVLARRGRAAVERPAGRIRLLPWSLAGLFALGYFALPEEAGRWFYVYPREIVAVALALLAAVPDVPARRSALAVASLVLVVATVPTALFAAASFREFDVAARDFRAVLDDVPRAPRLLHLLYELGPSAKRVSPFLHLPAWVQAEKGGTLAFHFVSFRLYPIRYRPGAEPPELPARFEWTPEVFRLAEHGRGFDTFLVRHRIDPGQLFESDPSIHLTAHHGTWWLYRRAGSGSERPATFRTRE